MSDSCTQRPWIWLPALALLAAAACQEKPPDPWFVDVAESVGIRFRHQDGRTGQKYYVETAASGGGWIDHDADGDLDLFLVNGAATPGSTLQDAPFDVLYENRGGRFVDVTRQALGAESDYGMGVCAGDYDGDGLQDFLVTNYGEDRLYHNLGAGRFEEIGRKAGVADPRWATGCAFGDLDGDGKLDLYVAHYVDFSFENNPYCGDRARGLRAYCRPEVFPGVPDSLFINQGDGTFRDEGTERGLAQGPDEKGFGVILGDLDDDRDLDVYVANDGTPNRLYVNDGKGFFEDQGLVGGTALNSAGRAESGMGVDAGDVDNDGRLDLIVTNYSLESNTLYRNLGGMMFEDFTRRAGIVEPSWKQVGWGVGLADFDNDGDLDLAVANGHAVDNIELFEPDLHYRQRPQLFENTGGGRFREVTDQAGPAWAEPRVGRGLAVGDWNDDGRLDILLTNTNAAAELLENRRATGNHWLGIVLRGPPGNVFAIGAKVRLRAGPLTQVREVRSGGSFLCQPDIRLHFGLGIHSGPVAAEVRWPDGTSQVATSTELDRYWTLQYEPQSSRTGG